MKSRKFDHSPKILLSTPRKINHPLEPKFTRITDFIMSPLNGVPKFPIYLRHLPWGGTKSSLKRQAVVTWNIKKAPTLRAILLLQESTKRRYKKESDSRQPRNPPSRRGSHVRARKETRGKESERRREERRYPVSSARWTCPARAEEMKDKEERRRRRRERRNKERPEAKFFLFKQLLAFLILLLLLEIVMRHSFQVVISSSYLCKSAHLLILSISFML